MSKKETNIKKEVVTPIKPALRPLLEAFMTFEPYQEIFLSFTRSLGYRGDDMDRVRQLLFTVQDGEIGFNILGMHDLFLEFQLFRNLSDKEPYKTLLEEYPEAIHSLQKLARKVFKEKEITEDDIKDLFDIEKYDNRESGKQRSGEDRSKGNSEEESDSEEEEGSN